jgi:5-hydroxyisourate hydrolase
MSDQNHDRNHRRDFLTAGLAIGAAALIPESAKAADPAPKGLSVAPTSQSGAGPRLTMHAIDTFHGATGAGLKVDLSIREGNDYKLVKSFETIAGGRSDGPVLVGDQLKAGRYEMLLHLDDYFAKLGAKLPNPSFLNKVPIRFTITDVNTRYHVPILFSPWGYSFYRGS